MPPPPPPSLPHLRTLLSTFTTSPSRFSILSTHPHPPPKTLYILDSSFNPPTLAHLSLCTTALLQHDGPRGPKTLLLLLAIKNADKAPQPARFEHRLAMMGIFAAEVAERVRRRRRGEDEEEEEECGVSVDVGVIKEPFFHDKTRAIEASAAYADPATEQVLLLGFDTLTRLLDPSYYPPSYTLAPLAELFARHRVRVTLRAGYGAREEQRGYLGALGRGEREGEGGRREWAGRIEVVEGEGGEGEGVSSSGVREGVRKGGEGWRGMVTEGVRGWIEGEGLYGG